MHQTVLGNLFLFVTINVTLLAEIVKYVYQILKLSEYDL